MPPNPSEEESQLQLELKQLQTVRASFEALKGYIDGIAASVEGTLGNFTAVNGYAKRLEAVVGTAEDEGANESEGGKGSGKERKAEIEGYVKPSENPGRAAG
ncbi:MAG: hypothetical protein M1840_003398 [Geoglossum simile]|nr:MAG: hypothetical protein M1840_003398 [Geoglossum simile]